MEKFISVYHLGSSLLGIVRSSNDDKYKFLEISECETDKLQNIVLTTYFLPFLLLFHDCRLH